MSYYYESKADRQNYHYVNRKTSPGIALHFHSAIEFLIVRRGCIAATVGGCELIIGEGEGCFACNFLPHSCRELEENTLVYAIVGNSSLFEPIFSDLGGTPDAKFKFCDFSLLDQLIERYERADGDRLRLSYFKSIATLTVNHIAENDSLIPSVERGSSDDFCAILRYISEHFTEDISLLSLSSEFGYSPQYFSRIFHRYMNINLTEYVNIARVNYAKKLLRSGKNVSEIAFECGFGSMPSFYRAYKKVFGELPRG